MFVNAFRIEQSKLVRRKLLWVELVVLAVLVILMNVMFYVATQTDTPDPHGGPGGPVSVVVEEMIVWPNGLLQAIQLAAGNGFGGLLLIIVVGSITAQEYTWRTLHLWLSHGLSRITLLAAKFAIIMLVALILVLTATLVGAVVTGILTVQLQGSLNINQVDWGQVVQNFVYTAYTMLPYAALTFMLAIITRSTVAAVGIGIAYTLLLEGLVVGLLSLFSGTVGKIAQYLPVNLTQSLLNSANPTGAAAAGGMSFNGQPFAPQLLDPLPSAIGIALYTAAFVGIAIWSFRRQDMTAE